MMQIPESADNWGSTWSRAFEYPKWIECAENLRRTREAVDEWLWCSLFSGLRTRKDDLLRKTRRRRVKDPATTRKSPIVGRYSDNR